jgi:hypothetical protein
MPRVSGALQNSGKKTARLRTCAPWRAVQCSAGSEWRATSRPEQDWQRPTLALWLERQELVAARQPAARQELVAARQELVAARQRLAAGQEPVAGQRLVARPAAKQQRVLRQLGQLVVGQRLVAPVVPGRALASQGGPQRRALA